MIDKSIETILKKIIWDYNISVEDIYNCLSEKTEKAGFYSKNDLLIKMFEHLSWYEIIKIISFEEIKIFLTSENISKIYPKGLQIKYEILRKLLHQESISSTGWNSKDIEFLKYAILSNRWYCFK